MLGWVSTNYNYKMIATGRIKVWKVVEEVLLYVKIFFCAPATCESFGMF